jgi:hypothetical protein
MRLFYQNPSLWLLVSQRTGSDLARFAAFKREDNLMEVAARKSQDIRKYQAVNLLHANSVELRIFRGNLRMPRFLKNLEAALAAYLFTLIHPVGTASSGKEFCSWLEQQSAYPNLLEWIHNEDIANRMTIPYNDLLADNLVEDDNDIQVEDI